MHCSCVRQTELPQTSALFCDLLYHPDRVAQFYAGQMHDLEAILAVAPGLDFSDERRAALIAALRVQNPESEALRRLAQPGTVAVVTGQQVGLFSGAAYTIYKALSAVKVAEALSSNGIQAVPVFWLATQDHDFAEVNHVWIFDAGHRPIKVEMRRSVNSQPVGEIGLGAEGAMPPVAELRSHLSDLPFGDEVAQMVEASYQPGSTMGKSFGELLRRILAPFDILQVDPMLPGFRALAAPCLRAAVEGAPELSAQVLQRSSELKAAGYHAQVHVEDHTSFFFLLENGKRLTLRRHRGEYVVNGRRFSKQELMDRAADLSPNALLRPVVQDSILPTVAYIGGPAELAYLAQSEVLYRDLLGRMPVVMPRAAFTLLDRRSQKLLERYSLGLPDFFHGEEALRDRIATKLIPGTVKAKLEETARTVNEALARLEGEITAFDPTLGSAIERSSRKIRYQVEKIQRKTGREALRRDGRAARDASFLYNLIYPERHLQERVYSILPFLAKHGLDLPSRIYGAIELGCPDHRLAVA